MNMKEYALTYAKNYNMAIIPLHNIKDDKCTCLRGEKCGKSSGKHPRLANWQNNWSKDPARIEEWWTKWPDANIGMVTGKASGGICVVDVDEEIGRVNLAKYVNGIVVPVSSTARGDFEGEHWFFKTEADVPDKIKGIKGLDFRNFGIIVLPPSQGLAKRYKWKVSPKGIEFPVIPDKLLSDLVQVTVSQSESVQVTASHESSRVKASSGSAGGGAMFSPKDYIKSVYNLILNSFEFKDNAINFKGINFKDINYKLKDISYKLKDKNSLSLEGVGTEGTEPTHFVDGCRENDLFSLANALIKAGKDYKFVLEVMTRVMFTCHDVDPGFIIRKIENAVKRHGEPVPNLYPSVPICTQLYPSVPSVPNDGDSVTNRVREYVGYTEGAFSTSDCYRDLGLVTATDKTICRKALGKMIKEGILEHTGSKSGHYRKVQNDLEEIDLDNINAGNYYELKMPMALHERMNFYPKGIMVIAGSSNSGKTAFVMRMALLNNDKEVFYFNSEMGPEELLERIEHFEHDRSDWKHVKFYNRSQGFHDVIRPNGLNIIDFLEIGDNFYQMGELIRQIHDKLDRGAAVICLQKTKGSETGRGGSFSLEKPRIYLSMDFQMIKVVKCKSSKHGLNMNGKEIPFKLINGANFIEMEAV